MPHSPAGKAPTTRLHDGQSREHVQVKLVEGSDVRLRNGRLVSLSGRDVSALQRITGGPAVRSASRLFTASEAELTESSRTAARRSGRGQADLNLWFRLTLPRGAEPLATIDALNALDIVETAYAEPLPVRLPLSPDYRSRQGYHSPASASGIDANFAFTVPGGAGANVRVHDIEYSWNGGHEDLSKIRAALYANGTPRDPFGNTHHGTAVVGEIVGDDNASGVTGLVPHATMQLTNAYNAERGLDLANAVFTATRNLRAGDVMLLEQQTVGANGGCGATSQVGCVAVEYIPSVYDAIVNATSQGVHVVEAAGNGAQNLDGAEYGTVFPRGRADSGAIIVGAGGSGVAGCSAARARLGFSNHGRRVDLQGWGECVTTTGYGDLYNASTNAMYTHTFGGTSSASPIVASAVASLSSVAKQRGVLLSPRDLRARLKATGTPQAGGSVGNIGPLPNLRSAIAGLSTTDTTAPSVSVPAQAVPTGAQLGSAVPVRASWSASDASGIAGFVVYLQNGSGPWVQQSLPTTTATRLDLSLARGSTYRLAVAAQDRAGNWSSYAIGAPFGVGAWEQDSGYTTFSSGWTSTAWTSASGGSLAVSPTPSASASFTFTGRNVAWVGSRGVNRGQAHVYLDGAYRTTIDLYAASTAARTVLASYTWATAGTHTMKVVVVGTAGRPAVDVDAFARLS